MTKNKFNKLITIKRKSPKHYYVAYWKYNNKLVHCVGIFAATNKQELRDILIKYWKFIETDGFNDPRCLTM